MDNIKRERERRIGIRERDRERERERESIFPRMITYETGECRLSYREIEREREREREGEIVYYLSHRHVCSSCFVAYIALASLG